VTPDLFLTAVRTRLGIEEFVLDCAADEHNTKAPLYWGVEHNALVQPWDLGEGWNWCNPPYAKIKPWVKKAHEEMRLGVKTAMLLPAGVGANWYRQYVHMEAPVLALNGRLTFVGHPTPYPKDMILILWDDTWASARQSHFDVWTWNAP